MGTEAGWLDQLLGLGPGPHRDPAAAGSADRCESPLVHVEFLMSRQLFVGVMTIYDML